MDSPAPTPSSRHPRWFDSESDAIWVVFQVEDILYKQNVKTLARYSEVFQNLYAMHQEGGHRDSGKAAEGTEENPVRLEGIPRLSWEKFLAWITNVPFARDELTTLTMPEQAPQAWYTDLLHISDMLLMPEAMRYAVNRLGELRIAPAEKLAIARQFRIRAWIDSEISALLFGRYETLHFTSEDIANITPEIFLIILRAREDIEVERKLLASTPFTLKMDDATRPYCNQHGKCIRVMKESWSFFVVPQLIHPFTPLRLDIPYACEELIKNVKFPGMSPECQRETVTRIINQAVFTREVAAIREAVIIRVAEMIGRNPLLEGIEGGSLVD